MKPSENTTLKGKEKKVESSDVLLAIAFLLSLSVFLAVSTTPIYFHLFFQVSFSIAITSQKIIVCNLLKLDI